MIYIAAQPDVFKCIVFENLDTTHSPLTWYLDAEEGIETGHKPSGLTGATRRLVEAALSLYNGYQVGLDFVFSTILSDELYKVLIEACNIRARKCMTV